MFRSSAFKGGAKKKPFASGAGTCEGPCGVGQALTTPLIMRIQEPIPIVILGGWQFFFGLADPA
jgi:hypothetical protein